ncbi:MAG TPA: hypothetical protein VFG04_29820 [Planctomycetaceae bacterium]|jgi:hypothetical protein|nr:hypothetical protein [Planctomycetaceae bacterium]
MPPEQVALKPIAKRHYAFEGYQCPPELGVGLRWLGVVGPLATVRELLGIEPSYGAAGAILAILCFMRLDVDLVKVDGSRWLAHGLFASGVVASVSLGMALDWLTRTHRSWALAPLIGFVGGTAIGLLVRFGRSRFNAAVQSRLSEMGEFIGEMRRTLEQFKSERGQYPHALEELVPEYLPSLPTLNWAFNRTLAYERLEQANPTSYTIGVDVLRRFDVWRFLFVSGIGQGFGAFWYRTIFEVAFDDRRAKRLLETNASTDSSE